MHVCGVYEQTQVQALCHKCALCPSTYCAYCPIAVPGRASEDTYTSETCQVY